MSFTVHARTGQRLPTTGPSLLAACIAMALLPSAAFAADTATTDDTVIVEGNALSTSDSQDQDYSVKTTTTGTKLLLVPRDIPQSVSVISQQRMRDQKLTTIGDVLSNTTGVTASKVDSSRVNYFSRGFFINNFSYDDLPTYVSDRWNFGDTASDTAMYDRIEVVRGAAGLMNGTGNPSAYINMVRKHADSNEFEGSVSAETGSWNKQRYVLDLQSPLTDSGKVRGRVIAGYQDNDTWLDRNSLNRKFLYTIVDADLTDSTTLSVGFDHLRTSENGATWGDLATWFSDGSRTHFNRSDNTAPDWAYTDKETNKVFANLVQRFDNGWEARINAMHSTTKFDSKLAVPYYVYTAPDKDTGAGVVSYGGWNRGERTQDALDIFARGGFDLLGRQHELVFGGSYSRQENNYENSFPPAFSIDNIYGWNGKTSNLQWSDWKFYSKDTITQQSLYAATRLSLADPLHLIVGARYTNWNAAYNMEYQPTDRRYNREEDLTPYAGIIYDINDAWSAYASYTAIFQPTEQRDANSQFLAPTKGNSYEAGVKADWFNTRLTTSLAVFRTEQKNTPVGTGVPLLNAGGQTVYESKDAVSRGIEFELNGALTDDWQLTFGATRFIAEETDGSAINSGQPRTTVKLFTSYNVPALPELTVGGGVNWQNKTWQNVKFTGYSRYVEQGPYALVNLFSRYEVTKNLSVQANINNLFDKEYYDYLGSWAVYGAPRNFSVSANYKF